ncbi:hypothetical protein BRADI_1g04506v3 [Brachypodium distachyon]|uniref:Uncharacterized protein n=1 Tax=Brachypodium distachyon TaxID=15368 RepID=A0A0Q3J3L0_BRADI|nr:hypothetical protein BRADI_1g04506v3 [Brachypodium distachyon]
MKRNVAEVGQSSHQQSKDKGRSVAFNKSEFPPLVCKGKEKMVEKSTCKQLGKRGDVEAILPFASSSTGRPTNARNILRADAPEFIPSLVHKPSGECSKAMEKHSLGWKGVCLTARDRQTGHVNPTSALSNPLSEDAPVMRGSCEGSFDLVRHQRRQRNARRSRANLPAAVDQAAANRQRSHVSKSVKGRWEDTRPRMRVQNHDDSYVAPPGASTSRNDVGGAIMRQAEALAKRPEYEEFIQRHPERRKYVNQTSRVRSRRAAYKERERAVRARSESSRTQGAYTASSSENTCKKASNNMFEVFNALPVGITEAADDSSETSSTTIHFKRKRPRKEIVPGHRPVTRSLKNSSNEEENSASSGSYNPMRKDSPPTTDSEPDAREEEPHDFDPRCVEQVLATNETRSTEERLAQLTAALQQKDDELAALRA